MVTGRARRVGHAATVVMLTDKGLDPTVASFCSNCDPIITMPTMLRVGATAVVQAAGGGGARRVCRVERRGCRLRYLLEPASDGHRRRRASAAMATASRAARSGHFWPFGLGSAWLADKIRDLSSSQLVILMVDTLHFIIDLRSHGGHLWGRDLK